MTAKSGRPRFDDRTTINAAATIAGSTRAVCWSGQEFRVAHPVRVEVVDSVMCQSYLRRGGPDKRLEETLRTFAVDGADDVGSGEIERFGRRGRGPGEFGRP